MQKSQQMFGKNPVFHGNLSHTHSCLWKRNLQDAGAAAFAAALQKNCCLEDRVVKLGFTLPNRWMFKQPWGTRRYNSGSKVVRFLFLTPRQKKGRNVSFRVAFLVVVFVIL